MNTLEDVPKGDTTDQGAEEELLLQLLFTGATAADDEEELDEAHDQEVDDVDVELMLLLLLEARMAVEELEMDVR